MVGCRSLESSYLRFVQQLDRNADGARHVGLNMVATPLRSACRKADGGDGRG